MGVFCTAFVFLQFVFVTGFSISLIYEDCCRVRIRALDKFYMIKLAYGGLALGISQFLLLPELPLK